MRATAAKHATYCAESPLREGLGRGAVQNSTAT